MIAIVDAAGLHALNTPATVVSVALFLASLPIWIYAFGLALVRSARGDDIAVSSWVFLTSSAPKEQRGQLLGATGVCYPTLAQSVELTCGNGGMGGAGGGGAGMPSHTAGASGNGL